MMTVVCLDDYHTNDRAGRKVRLPTEHRAPRVGLEGHVSFKPQTKVKKFPFQVENRVYLAGNEQNPVGMFESMIFLLPR